jgi:hypothetical protein
VREVLGPALTFGFGATVAVIVVVALWDDGIALVRRAIAEVRKLGNK